MSVLGLFLDLANTLNESPDKATTEKLDSLFDVETAFAYIGNRKALEPLVLKQAEHVHDRMFELDVRKIKALETGNPVLSAKLLKLKDMTEKSGSLNDVVRMIYGAQWRKDSGVYPDFVLGWEQSSGLGNGALLELKDSRGDTIASFNSTIPASQKSLQDVQRITASNLVAQVSAISDLPYSLGKEYLSTKRSCFYFIRTRKNQGGAVRLSLVDGSFFETLPVQKMLAAVWTQILAGSTLDAAERLKAAKALSNLEQAEIAKSRNIDQASVKPRFRIMSEVHGEGNPHRYSEVQPRTLNLIFKSEVNVDERTLKSLFEKEAVDIVKVQREGDRFVMDIERRGRLLQLHILKILHKRNGEHTVIQYNF